MSSVLKIMPEPIQERSKSDFFEQSQGVDDNKSSEFSQLFRQQLKHETDKKDANGEQSKPDVDEEQSGNTLAGQRQVDKSAAEASRQSDKKTVSEDISASMRLRTSAEQNAFGKDVQGNGELNGDLRVEMDDTLTQFLTMMEKSDQTLRHTTQGKSDGTATSFMTPHKKLSSAIETVLSSNGKSDMDKLFQLFGSQSDTNAEFESESQSESAINTLLVAHSDGKKLTLDDIATDPIKSKLVALLQGQQNQSESSKLIEVAQGMPKGDKTDSAPDLDALQTAGINGKIVVTAAQAQSNPEQLSTKGKIDLDAIQTAPIVAVLDDEASSNKGAADTGNSTLKSELSNIAVDPVKATEVNGSNNALNIAPHIDTSKVSTKTADKGKIDLDAIATAGINPKATIALAQMGKAKGADIGIEITPRIRPDNVGADVEVQNQAQIDQQSASGQTSHLTDLTAPTTKPNELVAQPNSPLLGTVAGPTDKRAAAELNAKAITETAEQAANQPQKKAESVLSAGISPSSSKDNQNILGTANLSKAEQSSGQQAEQQLSQENSGDQQAMAESAMLEQLNQENQPQMEQRLSNDFAQTFAKELNQTPFNKPISTEAPSINSLSQERVASLHNATADKLEKSAAQFAEALPITKPDLSGNMKERLMIMMNKGIQTADMRLDPAELGQMQVKMSVENDVTTVSFIVQNGQTKELLEQAMPKLKEMLAEQGINMGEGSVQQESSQQQQWGNSQNNGASQLADNSVNSGIEIEQPTVQQVKIANGALGGIDFFA